MVKKKIMLMSAAMISACLYSACASRNSKNPDWQITEQSQISVTQEEEDMETNTIESYENIQNFGYTLFAQNIQDENPVLSPVSAYLALSMAGCGADGTTKDEFYNVLGNDMMSLSDDIMNTLPTTGDLLNITIADSVWIDDEFIADDVWLDTVRSLMDSEAFLSDLATEETMKEINNWIDDKTNGLIDKMLVEPLSIQTRLALFNTVYFKGKWEIPFEAHDTYKESFYLNKDSRCTEQIDMMNLYMTNLEYIANDFAEGVILPYRKNDNSSSEQMAFIALKPIGDDDIRDIYSKLTSKVMKDILVNRQTELVNLKLPKFEMTFEKDLKEALSNMGLTECFDEEKANFDRMGKTQNGDNLYISLICQKAKIIVDEEGTEAAAATEVLMECAGLIMEPKEIRELYFNEPFIYMIIDMDKEIPLFVGILDNPAATEK